MDTGGTIVTDVTIVTGRTAVTDVTTNLLYQCQYGSVDTVLKFHLYLLLTENTRFSTKEDRDRR